MLPHVRDARKRVPPLTGLFEALAFRLVRLDEGRDF
jgi:hypothetical protein